jgi:hypothetical protein
MLLQPLQQLKADMLLSMELRSTSQNSKSSIVLVLATDATAALLIRHLLS